MLPSLPDVDGRCTTIDEVIDQLTSIVAWSQHTPSRDGYFAALYRKVTVRVKEGIDAGWFEDGARMERFDVIFANRYLQAWAAQRRGELAPSCWSTAFDAAHRWRPIILQHLLLGMNAHINFDLGIAAAQASPGASLPALRGDFDKINDVLASLLQDVQADVTLVSPWMGLLDRMGGRFDDVLINFSMGVARREAWRVAEGLAATDPAHWAPQLERLDRDITKLATHVANPALWLRAGLLVIRSAERYRISETIAILDRAPATLAPGSLATT